LVATLFAGLGAALVGPSLGAAYLDITEDAHRSRIMGLKGAAAALGGVAGPLLVAVASRFLPPQAIFGVSAAMAVFGALIALVALRDHPSFPAVDRGWDRAPELVEASPAA